MADEDIRDPEALESYRAWLAEPIEDEPHDPPQPARPCPVPIRPGRAYFNAAMKNGCEDEYLDRMKARYGEGWD